MTRSFYGNKMFIADLIIVTIWAFFNLRLSLWNGWPILVCIPMRLALCFQMQCKSPWTLYSSIVFLFCGSGSAFSDKAFYPFKRLAYYIGAWIGNGPDVVDAFEGELDPDLRVWLTIFGAILSLWIFGLPVVIGLFQRNIKSINWKRRWILIYMALSFIISIPIFDEEILVGAFMFGFFLCFLPVAYWAIYNRNYRSAFNLLSNYRPLVLYVAFVVLLALCLFIGIERWEIIKAIALIVMPLIFYALICRSCAIKPLTRHAVALSICGGLYFFILTAPEWFKITTLSVSGILALYLAIDIVCRYRRYLIGIAMFLMPTAIVSPLLLGMNPYVMLDTDSVSDSYFGYSTNDGFFIIEKDGKYGLRDRFGVVLTPKYDKFEKLDKWGRYISTNVCNGNMIADNRYGIFDLAKYEFILNPMDVSVAQLVQTGNLSFNLIAPDETQFATLHLRGNHPEKGEFVRETYIEPYHAPERLFLDEDTKLPESLKKDSDICHHGNTEEISTIEFPKALHPYNEIIDSFKKLKADMISSEYCLYDLTGDGIPELWVRSGSCEADKMMYVYIIRDDKAELLLRDSGGHSDLFESNGKVTNITCNCGGGFLLTYEYKRDKIVRSTPIEFSMFTEDGNPEALNKSHNKKLKHLWNKGGNPLMFIEIE